MWFVDIKMSWNEVQMFVINQSVSTTEIRLNLMVQNDINCAFDTWNSNFYDRQRFVSFQTEHKCGRSLCRLFSIQIGIPWEFTHLFFIAAIISRFPFLYRLLPRYSKFLSRCCHKKSVNSKVWRYWTVYHIVVFISFTYFNAISMLW